VTNNNSSSVTSTITTPPPPALISVVSQKSHAGPILSLPIDFVQPINGAITVEPRSGSVGHIIAFYFDTPIVSVDPVATVVDANNVPVGNSNTSFGSNLVGVSLASIPDRQRVTIKLTGINGLATAKVSLGFMLGDFNSSGSIDANDVSAVKSRSGQTVTLENFMFDVNRTGTISAADIAAVKARLGTTLP
jgi:hypothetical protein